MAVICSPACCFWFVRFADETTPEALTVMTGGLANYRV